MKRAPPHKHHVDRELLRKLYVDQGLSTTEISEILGISRMALNRIMKENRLSRRIEGLL
jgi:DNA-binding Lrp family transcriptional regulator